MKTPMQHIKHEMLDWGSCSIATYRPVKGLFSYSYMMAILRVYMALYSTLKGSVQLYSPF